MKTEFVVVRGANSDPLERFTYGLSFAHADRPITRSGIEGPAIPNAYNPTESGSGMWCQGIEDSGYDAFRHVVDCAVHEAVHESLEWIRLDGEILLDPHGDLEGPIRDCISPLVDSLYALAIKAYEGRQA